MRGCRVKYSQRWRVDSYFCPLKIYSYIVYSLSYQKIKSQWKTVMTFRNMGKIQVKRSILTGTKHPLPSTQKIFSRNTRFLMPFFYQLSDCLANRLLEAMLRMTETLILSKVGSLEALTGSTHSMKRGWL